MTGSENTVTDYYPVYSALMNNLYDKVIVQVSTNKILDIMKVVGFSRSKKSKKLRVAVSSVLEFVPILTLNHVSLYLNLGAKSLYG